MAEYITLTCPSCGSKLNITENLDRFACIHCGNEHIVNRGDGIVSISPIVEGLEKVQRGTDKTASELAIKRIKTEISELEQSLIKSEEKGGQACIYSILIAFVPIIIFLFFAIVFGDVSPFFLVGFIIIGGFIYYLLRASSSSKKGSSEIKQLINKKKKELRKHLDEVSD